MVPIIPISCFIIYQPVAQVDLVVCGVRTRDIEYYLILLVFDTHVCAHPTRVTANTRGGELYLG
jgi:hypothetical protein